MMDMIAIRQAALTFVLVLAASGGALAQSAERDSIADLIDRDKKGLPAAAAPAPKDPRSGDKTYEEARRLMAAIDAVLRDTADNRAAAKKLPAEKDFLVTPIWTETREDRERKVRTLLDSALGIVTTVPVVDSQKRIEALRANIREIEDQVVAMREKQMTAPKGGVLPGVWTDTVASLDEAIADAGKRIEKNRETIAATKREIKDSLAKSGVELTDQQLDLLLDGVLADDLVRLIAVFQAAKLIDGQLAKLLTASGDNMNASRRYFAMHAVLFAMLVHAQDMAIAKIDDIYVPKLDAILKDIGATRVRTNELVRAENRPDQVRALEANRDSLKVAEDAARAYRRYLQQQRDQIARARTSAAHDLRIADNTFETVEASFQLRDLMRDSAASFEALQRLEAPTFDQIFKNEELRREFEDLTRKLEVPSS
jgi:polyhydroxyalkanoate synthesis regulator phasin